jgi:hypothetical protein
MFLLVQAIWSPGPDRILWFYRAAKLEGIVVLLFLIWRFARAPGRGKTVIQKASEDTPAGRGAHGDYATGSRPAEPSNRSFAVRSALIAAGLATLLSPLFLVAGTFVLFATGLLGSPAGDAPLFLIIGTILLFIPEATLGLIFGGACARFGWRGPVTGATRGAVFWLLGSAAVILVVFVIGYHHDATGYHLWRDLQEYAVPLTMIVAKEFASGLIIGGVIGWLASRHHQNRARSPVQELTQRTIVKQKWFARPMTLAAGSIGLAVTLVLSALLLHDWQAPKQAREALRRRALTRGVAARDLEAGGHYALSLGALPNTVVLDQEPYEQWLPPRRWQYVLLRRLPSQGDRHLSVSNAKALKGPISKTSSPVREHRSLVSNAMPPLGARRYEAEDLAVIASHLCQTSRQRMTPWGEKLWSRGAQLFCGSNKGGWVELRLPVERSGLYRIDLYATRAPDFGRIRVSLPLGAAPVVGVIDLYGPQVEPSGPIMLGWVRLEAGNATLHFEVLDKQPASRGYRFGIDCLDLVAQ